MTWPDTGTQATIAAIIAAFSAAMLMFGIQRELRMNEAGEINWIPRADWLLLLAGAVSLLFLPSPFLYRLRK